MLTKAAKLALRCSGIQWENSAACNTVMFPNDPVKDVNNANYYIMGIGQYLFSTYNIIRNATGAGISFGTGTTAATENDYRIETPITDGNFTMSNTRKRYLDNGVPTLEINCIVTNNTANSITITEVAITTQGIAGGTSASSTTHTSKILLIDRTVLATPVTVASGANAAIKYKISMDMTIS